ncbi:MAG TPA: Gfo/Idh/MocA family oxidoreductase [Ktedonobacteraceae bacterium]
MAIRLIQIGLGGWGRNWFHEIVAKNQMVETVAWVEIDAQALAEAQQKLELPKERCFLSTEEALAAVPADAVLITASLPGHVPAARAALLAGKHVLLEKPFAPTLEEAQELITLAEQQQRILMISQNYRFGMAVQKARELVRQGTLGGVSSVEIDFRRSANTVPATNHRHYQLWHPLLADMAIHHFDLMRYVLGQEPLQISCQTWNPSWSNFVQPPAAALTVTLDGGTVVNYRGSWISQGPTTNWCGEWSMDCAEGQIIWTGRGESEKVQVRPSGKRAYASRLPALAQVDRAGSLQAFVQALENNQAPESSGRDNLKTLALMFAAIRSAESGLPVAIADLLPAGAAR